MNATPDTFARADRLTQGGYTLAPPVDLATGGRRFQMVLAVPGVMSYATGAEYVPPETLRDPAWLEALSGVPVVWDDVETHLNADGQISPDTMSEVSVGRILRAWWDEAEQAVKADAVIDTTRGLDLIAHGVTGVSPGYRAYAPPESGEIGGVRYSRTQRRRFEPTNVALTGRPRGGVTNLRADAMKDIMDKIEALLDKRADAGAADMLAMLVEMLMSEKSRGDAMMAERDQLKADMDAMRADMDDDDEIKADAVGDYVRAIDLARSLDIEIDDGATLVDLERTVADSLDVRADASVEHVKGALAAAMHQFAKSDAYDRVRFTQGDKPDHRADARNASKSYHPTWPAQETDR